jgi:TRAP-type mannitol/chloroaromatic compound transport system permease large subunit
MLSLMFVLFVVLLVLGLDLWYAHGVSSLLYPRRCDVLRRHSHTALTLIPPAAHGGHRSFPLLAVPMFILAGELMSRGGVTYAPRGFLGACWWAHQGGACAGVGAGQRHHGGMSGSAAADLAATGSLLIPGPW